MCTTPAGRCSNPPAHTLRGPGRWAPWCSRKDGSGSCRWPKILESSGSAASVGWEGRAPDPIWCLPCGDVLTRLPFPFAVQWPKTASPSGPIPVLFFGLPAPSSPPFLPPPPVGSPASRGPTSNPCTKPDPLPPGTGIAVALSRHMDLSRRPPMMSTGTDRRETGPGRLLLCCRERHCQYGSILRHRTGRDAAGRREKRDTGPPEASPWSRRSPRPPQTGSRDPWQFESRGRGSTGLSYDRGL
mmetsp:Transcript_39855/g.93430  ORF Transcript_39855/g.93430 Transcript_39855/m.93430 type:complete len:243 (-) Transcript_39855:737-1465(-)